MNRPPEEEIPPDHRINHSLGLTRDVLHKTGLWVHTLGLSRFYLFGEIGNLLYTIGKSILEGAVLYTMFTMAEDEYRVAAVLGVLTKYIYPGITFVSSVTDRQTDSWSGPDRRRPSPGRGDAGALLSAFFQRPVWLS